MKKFYVGLNLSSFKLIIMQDSTVVDEKNRRVIHTIDWKLRVPRVFQDMLFDVRNDDEYIITGRAKGVAVCHKEDQFDPEIGKKLARAMAESNAYLNASKRMQKYVKSVSSIVNAVSLQTTDFMFKANEIRAHNCEYMKKLIEKE